MHPSETPLRLWRTISRIPSLRAPKFLWYAELGEHWELCQQFLTATSDLAAWTLAGDGVTVCEVVEHNENTFVAIDQVNDETFGVDREWQVIYKLSQRLLSAWLMEAIGGRVDYSTASTESAVIRIGRLPPRLAAARICLCPYNDSSSLLRAFTSIASTKMTVLVVPTLRCIEIDTGELEDKYKTIVIAANDLFSVCDDSLVANPKAIDELRYRLGVNEDSQTNSFKLAGEHYQICFEGKSFSLSDAVGLWYLREFLSHPQKLFDPIELEASRTGVTARSTNSSTGEAFDEQARKEYAKAFSELDEGIAEAESFSDFGQLEKLQNERQELIDFIAKDLGKGGKARIATDAARARKNIRQSVSRDVERIRKFHPNLADHFKFAFRSDAMSYQPDIDPNWEF